MNDDDFKSSRIIDVYAVQTDTHTHTHKLCLAIECAKDFCRFFSLSDAMHKAIQLQLWSERDKMIQPEKRKKK